MTQREREKYEESIKPVNPPEVMKVDRYWTEVGNGYIRKISYPPEPALVLKASVLQNGTGLVLRNNKVVGEAIPKIAELSLVDIEVREVGDVLRSSSEFDSNRSVDGGDRERADYKEGTELLSMQPGGQPSERPLLDLQEIGDIENEAGLVEGFRQSK